MRGSGRGQGGRKKEMDGGKEKGGGRRGAGGGTGGEVPIKMFWGGKHFCGVLWGAVK